MAKVAVAQMTSSSSIKDNLETVRRLVMQAKEQGAELLLLPENFAFMGMDEANKLSIAEIYGQGAIQEEISQLAKAFSIWIIAGTIPIKGEGRRVRASSLVYDHEGNCVARYDKIHLFDVQVSEHEAHQESLTVEPGDALVVVETPVGRVGLSVCYDVRFPELYRQLELKGAQLFSIPAAFTAVTGLAHWEILLKARAIENLCYVLASNQAGQHENGRQTYGHSMIIEPWGKTLALQEEGNGIVCAEIELTKMQEIRQRFPCNEHHRLHR